MTELDKEIKDVEAAMVCSKLCMLDAIHSLHVLHACSILQMHMIAAAVQSIVYRCIYHSINP